MYWGDASRYCTRIVVMWALRNFNVRQSLCMLNFTQIFANMTNMFATIKSLIGLHQAINYFHTSPLKETGIDLISNYLLVSFSQEYHMYILWVSINYNCWFPKLLLTNVLQQYTIIHINYCILSFINNIKIQAYNIKLSIIYAYIDNISPYIVLY